MKNIVTNRLFVVNSFMWSLLLMSNNVSYAISDAPLLSKDNLVYKGAFKLPLGNYGASNQVNSFAYGGGPVAYNPENNTLIVGGHIREQMVAEVSIPTPVNNSNLSMLNRAAIVQGFRDITEGNMLKIGAGGTIFGTVGDTFGGGVGLGGLLIYKSKIIGTSFHGYDMDSLSTRSHFTANVNWSNGTTIDFKGMFKVGSTPSSVPQAGFIDGYMTAIPPEWQTALGGSVLSGQSALSAINRTSRGPAAFIFNPDNLGLGTLGNEDNPIPVTPLIYYTAAHPTLGDYGTNNTLYFTRSTQIKGAVFPINTRSVLFFGRTGLGTDGKGLSCYGEGTNVQAQAKSNLQMDAYWTANPSITSYTCGVNNIARRIPNVDECCYDPTALSKGDHGYPYVYYIWAYDANDLLLVRSGAKSPWEVVPYAIWSIDFPTNQADARILGAAYDPSSQRIFLSQFNGEPNGERFPLIHVFEVKTGLPSPPKNMTGSIVK